MFLFILLIFPVYFIYDYLQTKTSDSEIAKSKFFLFIQGIFVSVIFISLMALMFPYEQMISESLFQNFFKKSLYDIFLPFLFSFLYFFVFYKNLLVLDIKCLLSYLLGFYTSYLFYGIYTNPVPEQFFYLFCKPVLFLISLIAFNYWIAKSLSYFKEKKIVSFCLSIVLILILLLLPSMIECFWFAKFSIIWIILLMGFYSFLLLFFPLYLKK